MEGEQRTGTTAAGDREREAREREMKKKLCSGGVKHG